MTNTQIPTLYPTTPEPRFLTLIEVARIAHLRPRFLARLARAGLIPRVVLGHRTHLYDPAAVVAAINALAA